MKTISYEFIGGKISISVIEISLRTRLASDSSQNYLSRQPIFFGRKKPSKSVKKRTNSQSLSSSV